MADKGDGMPPLELTNFVQGLLQQMQTRFNQASDSIVTKIDEMGSRIDDLERSISDLIEQSGPAAGAEAPTAANKPASS